jgi:diguanylate cyclase (GGDEF)-like protein
VDQSTGQFDTLKGSESKSWRSWTFITIAVAILVIGLGASSAGAWTSYRASQRSEVSSARSQAQSQSAALAAALLRDLDFVNIQTSLFTSVRSLTNRQLAAWYAALDVMNRYPGTIGFGFVQRVPASSLATFGATVLGDPLNYGKTTPPYIVVPSTPRPEYCLQRYSTVLDLKRLGTIPPTFDFCSPTIPGGVLSPLPAILSEAARAGEPTVLSAASYPSTKSLGDLFIVFDPAYSSGAIPTTEVARNAQLVGWTIGTFSGHSLLNSVLGPTRSTSKVAILQIDALAGTTVVAAQGRVAGATASFSLDQAVSVDRGLWGIQVTEALQGNPWAQALIVGGLGILVAILLFAVLMIFGRSRSRALRLVDERTGQLRFQALHDALTGLPNRPLILDRTEQMLARGQRTGEPIAAMFLDLDDFKEINDSLGHSAGDELLRSVAERLTATVRGADSVGRLGGDEFVILIEGIQLASSPDLVAERLLAVLREPFRLGQDQTPFVVTASIGIARGQRPSAEDLLRDADVALYQAKEAGRNCFVMFEEHMHQQVSDRLVLEMELREAIDTDQFFLVYQPTFAIDDGTTTGLEALIRWQHPTRGVVGPVEFIPILEETGLIVPVGRWVIREACRQGAVWHREGLSVAVSVNVSARQLDNETLSSDVASALCEMGMPSDHLIIEVTESTLMRDVAGAVAHLEALKELGVRIAIDDFGTGYSSLSYLRQFPVDILKIDQSFIASLTTSSEAGAIIHTLVQLGKTLGLETVAEGIEQPNQLAQLRDEECETGQGFLYSRPLRARDVRPFLKANCATQPVTAIPAV